MCCDNADIYFPLPNSSVIAYYSEYFIFHKEKAYIESMRLTNLYELNFQAIGQVGFYTGSFAEFEYVRAKWQILLSVQLSGNWFRKNHSKNLSPNQSVYGNQWSQLL